MSASASPEPERFYVRESWGYLAPVYGGGTKREAPEFLVLDRWLCHRAVWSSLDEKPRRPAARTKSARRSADRDRRRAHMLSRRLNAGQMDAVA